MLDFTKNNKTSNEIIESLEQTHGNERLKEAARAIELAESYPVQGGDLAIGKENCWFSSGVKHMS